VVFIEKKQNKKNFEQPNNQKLKTKQKSFSGLRQFSIFFHENFWDWSLDV
jgi:hypothetical protein